MFAPFPHQVEADGTSVYTPRPDNSVEVHDAALDTRLYFRHFAENLVETVDNEGNAFFVRHTGDTDVSLAARGTDLVTHEEGEVEEEEEEKKEGVRIHRVLTYKQHAPRLLVLRPDGSGTELLRYQDVAEYVTAAEQDPNTAMLMDPLQVSDTRMALVVCHCLWLLMVVCGC